MKIFEVNADLDKYDACVANYKKMQLCGKLKTGEQALDFDGTSRINGWWPREMKRFNERPLGDYISNLIRGVIIMEKGAIDKLSPVMENVEILPLKCKFGDYWAVNILTVLDCLDYEKCDGIKMSSESFGDDPVIIYFTKYCFIPDRVKDRVLFKIFGHEKSGIYANELFVKEVELQGITGFRFEQIWESTR